MEAVTPNRASSGRHVAIGRLFLTFLTIGSTAFGGFMALISVVQNTMVERKGLLTHEDMLDGVSLATILPGPVAVNVCAYAGYRVRGIPGAVCAAVAVTLPSFLLILALSFAYFQYGQIPAVGKFFQGFIPSVAAIVATASWNMGKKAVKGPGEAVIAVGAFCLLISIKGFVVSLLIIVAGGIAGILLFKGRANGPPPSSANKRVQDGKSVPSGTARIAFAGPPLAASLFGVPIGAAAKLLVTFGGMSLLLFGGGYVFIPLMQQVVVDGYGWVTRQEFIDGIALGQVTPGPILISAAFIGYKVAGLAGATAATIGIFTPSAALMLVCTKFIDRIKGSAIAAAALKGIRPAVIGMIAAAAVAIGRSAQPSVISLAIFVAALAALLKFKLETAWIIPASGIVGLLLY